MFCVHCGNALGAEDNFCAKCGTKIKRTAAVATVATDEKTLEKELDAGKIRFINPETKEASYIQLSDERIKTLNAECKDDDYYMHLINNWTMESWLKEACKKLISVTKTVGTQVVRIGKWVLNCVVPILTEIHERLPNTIIGAVVGLIFGLVFSSIPVLGWLLGGLVLPFTILAGGVIGFIADMERQINNSVIAKTVTQQLVAQLEGLK